MGKKGPGGKQEADPALAYLEELNEETMSLAWGADKTPEDRRLIVLAATIFGRQFEERMRERPPENLEEREFQRFLMALMNAVISEFAEREGIDEASAAAFLGDVAIRDYVLELNEVLEEFANEPERSLNEHLKAAVENREEHARWADHWSSG
ncbi:MAG: hypothetical protein ACR2JR_02210 [Rubrobacteraceae bacterium]|nr:hypothetical protein [Rubrobacter sp.]MDQ3638543.1 hypothetical protein [Actinomycetota bacterium]